MVVCKSYVTCMYVHVLLCKQVTLPPYVYWEFYKVGFFF